jgi:hypothetical protein
MRSVRGYNTAAGQDRMANDDPRTRVTHAGSLPLALLLIAGGAACFAIALLAPAAARQTVALMGRSGAESASAELADAAAAAIEFLATVAVAAGAVVWWRARSSDTSLRTRSMVLAGGVVWCAATAFLAWIAMSGVTGALRVGPSTWITPTGASLALGALQVLGASLVVQGVRPGLRALGARSGTVAEARSAAGSLELAVVAATIVLGSRLFSLILPTFGWGAWTPLARVLMNGSGLILALCIVWGFVGCWQVARARQRLSAESAA